MAGNKKFKVTVNNSAILDIAHNELAELDIIHNSDGNYHLISKNKSISGRILNSDFRSKRYIVQINNKEFEISIKDELDQRIDDMGFSTRTSKHIHSVKAPMPGLILDILVNEGQEVKENDPLLILEAMKMENIITSPRSAVISSVSVKMKQAVDKNALLIEFE